VIYLVVCLAFVHVELGSQIADPEPDEADYKEDNHQPELLVADLLLSGREK